MVVCFNANNLVQVRISFGAHLGLLFLFEAISEMAKHANSLLSHKPRWGVKNTDRRCSEATLGDEGDAFVASRRKNPCKNVLKYISAEGPTEFLSPLQGLIILFPY